MWLRSHENIVSACIAVKLAVQGMIACGALILRDVEQPGLEDRLAGLRNSQPPATTVLNIKLQRGGWVSLFGRICGFELRTEVVH